MHLRELPAFIEILTKPQGNQKSGMCFHCIVARAEVLNTTYILSHLPITYPTLYTLKVSTLQVLPLKFYIFRETTFE